MSVGWILEDARERFLEGHPEPSRVLHGHAPPRYRCALCGQLFDTDAARYSHDKSEHRFDRPVLFIKGDEPRQDQVVRTPLRESDVAWSRCTECRIRAHSGKEKTVSLEGLQAALACQKNNALTEVCLTGNHSSSSTSYRLNFCIPSETSLEQVDALFATSFRMAEIQHAAIGAFTESLPDDTASREYGDALGNYVLGLLLKEYNRNTTACIGTDEFKARMQESFEILKVFERHLPRAICRLIRFNLNDLDAPNPVEWTTYPVDCPVDSQTRFMLAAAGRLAANETLNTDELELHLGTGRHITEYDRLKLHAISAAAFLRLNQMNNARPHLNAVRSHLVWETWARNHLKGAANDE